MKKPLKLAIQGGAFNAELCEKTDEVAVGRSSFFNFFSTPHLQFKNLNFYISELHAELGTRYFKSNDDIGTDTLLKSTVGTDDGTFFKKVTTISLLGTDFWYFSNGKFFLTN